MNKPRYEVGDKFADEDEYLNEIICISPTIDGHGDWIYFIKVTDKCDTNFLRYEHTYENYFETYCVRYFKTN